MEKDHQPDSMATVTIKPEYTPSEIYASSEPPPAYVKHVYASVQVAKIIAVTVVICSVILGFFLMASAYITANASCKQLEQEIELLGEVADRFQLPLQPEALVQEAPQPIKPKTDALKAEESQSSLKSIENNSIAENDSSDSDDDDNNSEEDNNEKTVRFKLPLQLDFDDLAGALIEKNQRSKMNCIVEKKRAEQLVDHQPKTVALPFGLNLTTDPRFERVTGERMAIFCESGTAQSASPSKNQQEENNEDEDQDEETIMIQPVMIPIPQSHYPTHMAQQMQPQIVPQRMVPQHMIHQQMVPPQMMAPRIIHHQMPQYPPQPESQQIQLQEHIMVQPQHIPQQQFRPYPPPPTPMETMRPPMPHPQMVQEEQGNNGFPPNNVLRQIAQQIIAQKIMEAQKEKEEQQNQEARQQTENSDEERVRFPGAENMMTSPRMSIPQAVLNQLSRLSSNRDVIVAVAEPPSNEEQQSQEGQMNIIQEQRPQEIRVIQEPRTNPSQMNGRQTYARSMPIDIPERMMKQEQEQEPEAQATEELRPHYVQPRSVRAKRAVDTLLEKSSKRVKRCSCDCSC
ncbi:putative uncharacterized protein DDB_G0271606 [Coccinella septempunctata]|uniref:putative uncharacterized protein DDB_G0271606 n=1 Tax=Coccinella septempunctata TaxID=41139 RepID=UPI001D07E685|nr:putative uncharacterized protein DDB_G0271606 [Coccinella septempunctata]